MKLKLIILFVGFVLITNGQTKFIKTVVHVLYTSTANNINDATVISYINQANKGFSKQLTKSFNRPNTIFDTIWENTTIQLCLATLDPNGNPTSGITHDFISNPLGEISNPSSPIWNTNSYLNIYLAPVYPSPGFPNFVLGGWASTPTNPQMGSSFDYVVVATNSIPYIPQLLTHEIGHMFGLDHLDNDNIADTPKGIEPIMPSVGYSSVCTITLQNSNTTGLTLDGNHWGGIDPPDMVENFMGLSFSCAYMFTRMQRNIMNNYITNHLSNLVSSTCLGTNIASVTNSENLVSVFPDPVVDYLFIDIQKQSQLNYRIEDINGRVILTGTTEGIDNRINVSSLSAGLYFLAIEDLYTKPLKFVKE